MYYWFRSMVLHFTLKLSRGKFWQKFFLDSPPPTPRPTPPPDCLSWSLLNGGENKNLSSSPSYFILSFFFFSTSCSNRQNTTRKKKNLTIKSFFCSNTFQLVYGKYQVIKFSWKSVSVVCTIICVRKQICWSRKEQQEFHWKFFD